MKWCRYFKTSNAARDGENKQTHAHFRRRRVSTRKRMGVRWPRMNAVPAGALCATTHCARASSKGLKSCLRRDDKS